LNYFIRHIAGEVAAEYEIRQTENRPVDDLMRLVDEMVPFHIHAANTHYLFIYLGQH
jgi:26S proteasome regulatory subunit N1